MLKGVCNQLMRESVSSVAVVGDAEADNEEGLWEGGEPQDGGIGRSERPPQPARPSLVSQVTYLLCLPRCGSQIYPTHFIQRSPPSSLPMCT